MSTLELVGAAPLLRLTEPPSVEAPVTFDLRALTWATPFDIVALAVLHRRSSAEGPSPHLLLPVDETVRRYLVDVGIHGHIPGAWGEGGGSAIEPPLVQLSHIESADSWEDMLSEIWPRVRGALPDHDAARRTIEILSELVDNATSHGRSAVGTFVCAQRYTGTTSGLEPGIWIGVADGGVGIPDHLRGNPKYAEITEDEELIRLARQPWVTGTSDRRGWGLVQVFEEAAAGGPSHLVIRSGRGEGEFQARAQTAVRARYRELQGSITGTWIHIRVDAT